MTTNYLSFVKRVKRMRDYQIEYFKNKSPIVLEKAKAMERRIDADIAKLEIELPKPPQQLNVFDDDMYPLP